MQRQSTRSAARFLFRCYQCARAPSAPSVRASESLHFYEPSELRKLTARRDGWLVVLIKRGNAPKSLHRQLRHKRIKLSHRIARRVVTAARGKTTHKRRLAPRDVLHRAAHFLRSFYIAAHLTYRGRGVGGLPAKAAPTPNAPPIKLGSKLCGLSCAASCDEFCAFEL